MQAETDGYHGRPREILGRLPCFFFNSEVDTTFHVNFVAVKFLGTYRTRGLRNP